MKDFGRWFKEFNPWGSRHDFSRDELYEQSLADRGLTLNKDMVHGYCCVCKEKVNIICDIEDYEEGSYYCGGSPRCCP